MRWGCVRAGTWSVFASVVAVPEIFHELETPGATLLSGPLLTLQTSHAGSIFPAATAASVALERLARTTLASGSFTFSTPAARSGDYQLSFPGAFDLSSSTYSLGRVGVVAAVTLSKAQAGNGRVLPSSPALRRRWSPRAAPAGSTL